jgi:hypothetical protein
MQAQEKQPAARLWGMMLLRKSTLPKGTSQVTTSAAMSTPSSLAASSSSICTYLPHAPARNKHHQRAARDCFTDEGFPLMSI